MSFAQVMAMVAGELALFAAAGFLLFALDDLAVDLLYFTRRLWRSVTVYRHHARADASTLADPADPGWTAVFVPAWEESGVIGAMLRETLARYGAADYRIFVGHYRNDPATKAAIAAVEDKRIVSIEVDADGPTTKAHCLNQLHGIM